MGLIRRATFPRGRRILDPGERINQGLLGWWSMDGDTLSGTTLRDLSGNGNDGTLTNSPTLVSGLTGQALQFNGSNQYVIKNSALVGASYPFTLCGWIKPNNAYSGIVGLGGNPNDTDRFDIEIRDSSEGNVAAVVAQGAAGGYSQTNSTAGATLGAWNFVVGEFASASSRTIRLNGGNSATGTAAIGTTGLTNTTIGAVYRNSLILPANGAVDDVRIYNRLLSIDEEARLLSDRSGNLGWTTPVRTLYLFAPQVASSFQPAWAVRRNQATGGYAS